MEENYGLCHVKLIQTMWFVLYSLNCPVKLSLNTVYIGFCDYGYSGQSGFSDCNPLDGPPSVNK